VLLAWRGQYDGLALNASLLLMLALGASLAGHLAARRPAWVRWPVWWAIGGALYYVAGLWPFLLFLLLDGFLEARQSQSWLKVTVLSLPALVLPAVWQLEQVSQGNVNPWGSDLALFFASLLFLFLPVVLLILLRLPKSLAPAPESEGRPRRRGDARTRNQFPRESRLVWGGTVFGISLVLAGWAVVWSSFDGTQKKLAQIEYYSALKQDEALLTVAAKLKSLPPEAELRVRLALYHTGRLTQDMFAYAHSRNEVMLPGLTFGVSAARYEMETLLELGQVGEAERMAQESLEFDGDLPDVLGMLFKVNVLKDRPKAAAVFLHALRQVPFQRVRATAWLVQLEHNPRLTGNQELDLVRSRMPTTDFPHGVMSAAAADMLRQLLASNPRNQMAFEYLMAQLLLSGELKKLASQIGQLKDFGYTEIPRHVEEALLLGQKVQGLELELHELKIRPDTIRRFQRFSDALGGAAVPSPAALLLLATEFGNTYWYYYYSRQAEQQGSPN
jgi:tetratricopeptide (TPR) repeat protein